MSRPGSRSSARASLRSSNDSGITSTALSLPCPKATEVPPESRRPPPPPKTVSSWSSSCPPITGDSASCNTLPPVNPHGVSGARRPHHRRVCAAGQGSTREGRTRPRRRLYTALRPETAPHGHGTDRTPNGAPRYAKTPREPETVSGIDQPPQSRRYRPGHGAGGKGIPGRQDSTREGPGTPLRHGRVRGFPENTP